MKKISFLILSLLPFTVMAQSVPTLVADIITGAGSGSPKSIVALGNEIVFQASGSSQINLFRYKPSVGVTQITGAGAYSAIFDTKGSNWAPYGVVNSRVFFYAEYPPIWPAVTPSGGSTYSIAEGGIPQVVDSATASLDYTNSEAQTSLLSGKLYGWGFTPAGSGLCYINSTNHVTMAGLFNPFGFWEASEVTACNNKIFFIANMSGSTGFHELQMFDPGTSVFTLITIPSVIGDQLPLDLCGGDNNTLYFSANTASEGRELYSYSASGVLTKLTSLNGTADGVYNNTFPYKHHNIIKFGNAIYFAGCNGLNGYDLMKYDIAASTTSLVKDINPSTGSSKPTNFYIFNGKLYFTADNGTNGYELWVTDGTAANTVMVADINPGAANSSPSNFCAMGGEMYFCADNGTAGAELFSFSGSSSTGIGSTLESGNEAVAFPNPSTGSVTVSIDLPTTSNVSVILSDINGRQVYRSEERQYVAGKVNMTIPMQNRPAGIYLYKVVSGDAGIIATGKVSHE